MYNDLIDAPLDCNQDGLDTTTPNTFYLVKYIPGTKCYSKVLVLFSKIMKDCPTATSTVGGLIKKIGRHVKTIVAIPILNGTFCSADLLLDSLPSKLIVIVANMNTMYPGLSTFECFMNILNRAGIGNPNVNIVNNAVPDIPDMFEFAAPSAQLTPEQHQMYSGLYNEQIEQMKSMGFMDEVKIIYSLFVCDGDVNNAINYYLQ
tara:strand:+ start:5764 stop:6375 length:612 start_codon:yes stop_codon:yes gene_type:complete